MRTLKLSKAVHGHFGGPSDKLQQACPHLVIPAFHSPPEPHYHGFIGRVTNIIRVLPPVFNVYLCQTTQQVLKSSMMGGGVRVEVNVSVLVCGGVQVEAQGSVGV